MKQLSQALFDDKVMSEFYKSGVIGVKAFPYREIYLWVDLQVKVRGLSKNQAVLEAEIKFDKSERTIWNALDYIARLNNALVFMEHHLLQAAS